MIFDPASLGIIPFGDWGGQTAFPTLAEYRRFSRFGHATPHCRVREGSYGAISLQGSSSRRNRINSVSSATCETNGSASKTGCDPPTATTLLPAARAIPI